MDCDIFLNIWIDLHKHVSTAQSTFILYQCEHLMHQSLTGNIISIECSAAFRYNMSVQRIDTQCYVIGF